jgi:DNA-binding LacI/PurR family transcriptional regulator
MGVSRKAVAFAISPDPHLNRKLSPKTRQRILDAVERMGYVPHHAASRLARVRAASATRRAPTMLEHVAMICQVLPTQAVDPTCLAMMGGAELELSTMNATLSFVRVSREEDWQKVKRLARAGAVDGWLLYGTIDDQTISHLKQGGAGTLPHVILGNHRCSRTRVPFVDIDSRAVGRLAAEHLARLGHRRIGYLHGNMQYDYQQRTMAGFREAVKEFGLDEDERLFDDQRQWLRGNVDPSMQWLRATNATALFTPEFDCAAAVCGVLRQARVEVPAEVSVLACEDASGAARNQNLARIEESMEEIGRRGATLLRELASNRALPRDQQQIKVEPALVKGWSTGVLRTANRMGDERATNSKEVHS